MNIRRRMMRPEIPFSNFHNTEETDILLLSIVTRKL